MYHLLKNKLIWLCVFLAVILTLGLVWFSQDGGKSSNTPSTPEDIGVNTPRISKEDADYQMSMALESEKIESEREDRERAIAITNSAILSGDSGECEVISFEDIKKECKDRAGLSEVIRSGEISRCIELSPESQTICKDQLTLIEAQKKSDPASCKSISNTGSSEQCLKDVESLALQKEQEAISEGKIKKKDCEKYEDSTVEGECVKRVQLTDDYTFFNSAVSTKNATNCQKIVNDDLRVNCEDSVYFAQAKSNTSLATCDKIKEDVMKTQCRETLVISLDGKTFQTAIQTRTLEMCDQIVTASIRMNCIDRINITNIISSGKIEDCETLFDTDLQDTCKKALVQ